VKRTKGRKLPDSPSHPLPAGVPHPHFTTRRGDAGRCRFVLPRPRANSAQPATQVPAIVRELGIPPKTREWDGVGSLVAFVVSQNLHRRHLTPNQKAALGADIEPMLAEEKRKLQQAGGATAGRGRPKEESPAKSAQSSAKVQARVPEPISKNPAPQARDEAAKLVGSSPRAVSDAKAVKEASPTLFAQVKAGEITLPQAKHPAPVGH